MKRRTFMKVVSVASTTPAILNAKNLIARHAQSDTVQKPNIIFIMADDMGYGDVACYNPDSKIPTPFMDKLASQGIRCDDAHSPSAVCTPTRYGVLTGRYCWRSRLKRGVFGGYNRPLIQKDRMTLASMLKTQGYNTACIGKWHLGLTWQTKDGTQPEKENGYEQMNIDFSKPVQDGPTDLGFDYFFGTAGCTTDDPPLCYIENNHTVGIPDIISPADTANEFRELLMVPGWKHEDTDLEFTNKTIGFIEKHVQTRSNDPFFVYLPLSVPHIPWIPPKFVKEKSQAGPRGDQVVLMDWIVGQIMETLERLRMEENTLLIVSSDNGPRKGVHGHQSAGTLRGFKGSIWEGGHRVPFIARWPAKIKAGVVNNQMISLTDLMATCAAVAGATLPQNTGEDSFNILPILTGEALKKPVRDTLINHSGAGVFAIREGNWKLIQGSEGAGYHEGPADRSKGQLFDMAKDSGETNNLWKKYPQIAKKLNLLLEKQKKDGRTRPV